MPLMVKRLRPHNPDVHRLARLELDSHIGGVRLISRCSKRTVGRLGNEKLPDAHDPRF
jgi:hypothetical protein